MNGLSVTRTVDIIIEAGVIGLIVLTPWAFGSVHPISYTVLEIAVYALVGLWMVEFLWLRLRRRTANGVRAGATAQSYRVLRRVMVSSGVVFVGLATFQLLPLHPKLLGTLSPKTLDLYEFCLAGQDLDVGTTEAASASRRPLSLYPNATRTELLKVLAYAGAFALVAFRLATRTRLRRVWAAIVITGFALSLLGIVQKATSPDKIYWFWRSKHGGTSFGPYVNRNHFAGYMDMATPLAIALGLSMRSRRGHRGRPDGAETGLHLPRGLWITMAVTMGIATMLSLSRGGMVSMALALAFMGAIRRRIARTWIVGAFACVVLASLSLKWEPLSGRIATLFRVGTVGSAQWRVEAGREALRIWGDFPLCGTGLSTFSSIDRKYRREPTTVRRRYVEVDWLQLVSEMGAVGTASAVTFLGGTFALALLWYRRDHVSSLDLLLVGSCTSMVAILIHSWGDFNLHMPANAFLFAVILGMTVAAARMRAQGKSDGRTSVRMENQRPRAGDDEAAGPVHRRSGLAQCSAILFPLAVIGIVFCSGRIALRAYRAHRAYTAFERSPGGLASLCERVARLHVATALDPTNTTYWYALGTAYEQAMRSTGEEGKRIRGQILRSLQNGESRIGPPLCSGERCQQSAGALSESHSSPRIAMFHLAVEAHLRAIHGEPAFADSHHCLAWLYEWAVAQGMDRYRPLIEIEFGRAVALWPQNPYLRYSLGTYYARHRKKSLAVDAYRASVQLSRQHVSRILNELWKRRYTPDEFRWVIAEKPLERLDLIDFYVAKRRPELAKEELRLMESDLEQADVTLKIRYLRRLLRVNDRARFERLGGQWASATSDRRMLEIFANGLMGYGKCKQAIGIYGRLTAMDRSNPRGWFLLGRACVRLGRNETATEAYRRALHLSPRTVTYRDTLGQHYLRRGDGMAAIAIYKGGCDIAPDAPRWHYRLGQAYEKMKNYVQAIACYRRAAEIAPKKTTYSRALQGAERKLAILNARVTAGEEGSGQ